MNCFESRARRPEPAEGFEDITERGYASLVAQGGAITQFSLDGGDLSLVRPFFESLGDLEMQHSRQGAFLSYCNSLFSLREKLRELFPELLLVTDCIYPAAQIDAALPLILFKSVRNILFFDGHQFAPPSISPNEASKLITPEGPWGDSYLHDFSLDGKNVANHLLGNILSSFGPADILNISAFGEGELCEDFPRVHGSISFKRAVRGDEEPVRNLVYMHCLIPNVDSGPMDAPTGRAIEYLDQRPPHAVLFKGSEGFFTEKSCDPGVHKRVIEWLESTKGFLIQGFTQLSPSRYEFMNPKKLPRNVSKTFRDIAYGYQEAVTVTKFL